MGTHPHSEWIIVSQALLAQQGKPAYKNRCKTSPKKMPCTGFFRTKFSFTTSLFDFQSPWYKLLFPKRSLINSGD